MILSVALPRPLPRNFYERNALQVTRDLIGKVLLRHLHNTVLMGHIVETEAYIGEDDPACHAARGLTPRTRIMYGPPGFSYVYFTYGMYYMLNAVCDREGFPAAVLIRAVEPIGGLEEMMQLRSRHREHGLTNGPGKLCVAFGITKELNGVDLTLKNSPLQICEGDEITTVAWSGRVGIREGGEKMWRCFVPGNPSISQGKIRLRPIMGRTSRKVTSRKSKGHKSKSKVMPGLKT
ncbi:MAG: DNA-3-methyladenine glycosylase [Acidobacteria bacterium]|nr:DNA-3-methyladenine glycosylase [Acidobacteriota bacterium]